MTNNIVTSATLAKFFKESNIEAVKVLGSGSYSTVILAKYPKLAATHPLIAIKNIDRRQAGNYVKRFLPRELEIVKAIQHPNICSVLEVLEHNTYLCFLTEFCDGGDLLEKINAAKRIPETEGKVLFRQLIEALSYLVENEIVHRDLKCENIFLDKHQNIKLGDFGFARYLRTGEKSKTFCGSRAYVAPEILRSVEYSGHTVDIWSSGVVLFVMLTGMMPYDERDVQKMIDTQLKHKVKFPRSVDLSVEARTLIYEILHPHPVSRPTCQQIKLSEWLKATPYVMHKAKLTSSIKISPAHYQSVCKKVPRMLHAAEKYKTTEAVLSWTLPLNLSQSHLGDRKTPSNACTMIAIHFADLCHRFNISLPSRNKQKNWMLVHSSKESMMMKNDEICARDDYLCLPEDMLQTFTNGIIDGNKTHESAIENRYIERVAKASKGAKKTKTTKDKKEKDRDIFTIPDSIDAIQRCHKKRIHEIDHVAVEDPFEPNFPRIIQAAIKSPHLAHMNRLYFILIAVKRAVFIAFQRKANTVALFDSHRHRKHDQKQSDCGGAIGCASANKLRKLARWILKRIYPELKKSEKRSFEISCIQVTGPNEEKDAPKVVYWKEVKTQIFREERKRQEKGKINARRRKNACQVRNGHLGSKQKQKGLDGGKMQTFEETRTGSGSSDEGTNWEDAMAAFNFLEEFDDENDMEEVGQWDSRLVDNESEKEQL